MAQATNLLTWWCRIACGGATPCARRYAAATKGRKARRTRMPRAMWRGAIQFGLVTIPVRLYLATESRGGLSFNLLHAEDGRRIQMKVHCPEHGEIRARRPSAATSGRRATTWSSTRVTSRPCRSRPSAASRSSSSCRRDVSSRRPSSSSSPTTSSPRPSAARPSRSCARCSPRASCRRSARSSSRTASSSLRSTPSVPRCSSRRSTGPTRSATSPSSTCPRRRSRSSRSSSPWPASSSRP